MLCLRNWIFYLLSGAALGCVSVGVLSVNLPQTMSDSPNDANHRGSGRLLSEVEVEDGAIAYRGTGRYQVDGRLQIAHRGSGRIDDHTDAQGNVAYRGTGRFSLDEVRSPEGTYPVSLAVG